MPRGSKAKKTVSARGSKWLPKGRRTGRQVIFAALFVAFILLTSVVAVVLAQRSQDVRNQAATCESMNMIRCGGCINDCRSYAKTCNAWIDEECKQAGCGGEGTAPGPGESCCAGLTQCGNGRCGKSCNAGSEQPGTTQVPPSSKPKTNICKGHGDCGAGFYCQTSSTNSKQGACVSRLANQSKCNSSRVIDSDANAKCVSNNCLGGTCVSAAATGRCSPAGAAGDAHCPIGSFCNDHEVCRAGRDKDATCSRDPQCKTGLVCINLKCSVPTVTNECTENKPCSFGKICVKTSSGNKCENRVTFNGFCHNNTLTGEDTCLDGPNASSYLWCRQGICTQNGRLAPNEPCTYHNQCSNNYGYGCYHTPDGTSTTCQFSSGG